MANRRFCRDIIAASSWLAIAGSVSTWANEGVSGLGGGRITVNIRQRFEYYQQDDSQAAPISEAAQASTLRLALGYRTPTLARLSAYAEYQAVVGIGENQYRMPTVPAQDKQRLPIISDPRTGDFSQYFLQYGHSGEPAKAAIGRQEIALGNGRFVDSSQWRQFHQSFEAVSLDIQPSDHLSWRLAFATKVHRVVGPQASDGTMDIGAPMFHLAYRRPGTGQLAVYGLMIDQPDAPGNSTKTFGMRAEGPCRISDSVEVLYAAEYARQTDYAGNPNRVDQGYLLGEIGASYKGWALRAQWNERQAASLTDKFNTPLSRPWDGWVEKFLITPSAGTSDHGLEGRSLSASGVLKAPIELSLSLTGYDYHASSSPLHYGSELDAGVEAKPLKRDPRLVVGWRFGRYFADALFTDSLRTSGYVAYAY